MVESEMEVNCTGLSISNLQSFLDCTTPTVEAYKLPKSWCRGLSSDCQLAGKDFIEYFNLGDLWEQYYEWSAYGAGVPLCLHTGDTVVQYYVPYLSSIQMFTNKSRNGGCDGRNNNCNRSFDAASKSSGSGSGPGLGHLYFEFFEYSSPYGRIPLLDKVHDFAQIYPGLTSFKSTELSPASWMSVAWYPIYHIPTKRNVKELTASFLTYHTLSSVFQDHTQGTVRTGLSCIRARNNGKKYEEKSNRISLPAFGLATYKLQGSLWTIPESGDNQRLNSLFNAADSWLKQLKVHHHDFTYFTTHSV